MDIKKYLAPALLGLGVILIVVGLLFPVESKSFTVVFNSDGGTTIENQVVKKGEKVTKPTNPTRESYTFVRWDVESTEYDFNSSVESDLTLKAIWNKVELPKHKVTLSIGDVVKDIEVTDTQKIDVKTLNFEEKSGYSIKWYVNGEEFDLNTSITSDMNIEGKYVKDVTFTVKFDSKGGSKVTSQTIKSGEKATMPTDTKKEGYVLDGWYLGNSEYDFNTPVTKNISLTAKWSEDSNITRYTVKFDSDGGSKVSDQKVIENKTASTPKTPTKSGYKFVEWDLDDKKYDFKTKVTQDITLKAKWEEDVYFTVTFDSNGGNKIDAIKVKPGEKVKKPNNPTKSGYDFVEWLYQNRTYDFNAPITGNITLTANYKLKIVVTPTPVPDKYTISINKVDNYSPSRTIKVLKNGKQISVSSIKAGSDGVTLCSGSNLTVDASEIENEKTLIVVLSDGKEVRVNVK